MRYLGDIWEHADRAGRVQLVCAAVAMAFVIVGFFVDWPAWAYIVLYLGIAVNVLWSYLGLRKAMKRLDEVLDNARRRAEIEYFEWLHDASPDD